jgi:AraC-like DNA-binding protein
MFSESNTIYRERSTGVSADIELEFFLIHLFRSLGSTSFSLDILELLAKHDRTWTEEQQAYYANVLQINYHHFTRDPAKYLQLKYLSESNSVVRANLPIHEVVFFPIIPELKDIFDFIDTNYQRSISSADVAQAFNYSPAYLAKIVRAKTGYTVNAWIVKKRIFEAQQLLKQTSNPIEEISQKVGYVNVNHFFRQFRQICNLTPSQWRKGAKDRSLN